MRKGAQIPAIIIIVVLFNIIMNIIISTLAFLLLTTELSRFKTSIPSSSKQLAS